MYDYVHPGTGLHKFFLSIIYAAINHPALMSAKILSASAWDELNTTEHISSITMQQSNITRELLNGALTNREQCFSDVTVAALLSLLLFDV
jgi:phospholipase/lecithinase/hemolysin